MKRHTTYIVAVLSVFAAMSIPSCKKEDPVAPPTPGKEDSAEVKADPSEDLLLLLAENGYTVYGYSQVAAGHKFTFHEPKGIESAKDKYPDGVQELTIPAGLVTKVNETMTRYTVYLKSGREAALKRYAEFRTSLPARMDTTVYRGVAFDVPFEVTASNGGNLEVSRVSKSGDAKVEVSLQGTAGGTITVVPTSDKGAVTVALTNGLLEVESEIAFDTYYLNVTDVPECFGDGNEFSFDLGIDSNLPAEEIIVESDSWIGTEMQDGRIAVRLAANGTNAPRTGKIAVKESKGLMEPVIVEIQQDCILTNKPGMIQFKDRAFKAASVAIADVDGDGEVSPDEALAVKELEISGKGIRDLTGIEAFKNLWKLNASNNNILNVDFSNPGDFANLKDINLKGNNLESGIKIGGCYCGDGLHSYLHLEQKYLNDLFFVNSEMSYYESTDFSQTGVHKIYEHTIGKGIALVFLTTQYLDVDYKSGGVNEILEYEQNQIFSTEPFASMKKYFDIYNYAIVAPSTTEMAVTNTEYTDFLNSLRNAKQFIIEIVVNSGLDRANGIRYVDNRYWKTTINLRRTRIANIGAGDFWYQRDITHELGHAIGGLEDQYEESRTHYNAPNFTMDETSIPWQRFLGINKYKERITRTYINSGYYPSENSLMGNNRDLENPICKNGQYFDSPSRFAIYSNIIWLSQDNQRYLWPDNERIWENYSDEQLWQDFLKYDVINDSLPI